ncbi:hypothetical protein NO1_1259 [Candidatus Termititenax aidoneus]|uniref:Uncharacterized protein n=1 Tax=Termititenax aidoneus TaxID=2218524 RepID=A0A388TB96_TERA1|nr:hypothetical protein NO1_1259 [Candidatus Termititenax aidoneus]
MSRVSEISAVSSGVKAENLSGEVKGIVYTLAGLTDNLNPLKGGNINKIVKSENVNFGIDPTKGVY